MIIKLIFIISFLFLTACPKSEPKIDLCVIADTETLHCFPTDKEKEEYEVPIKLGYMCASPDHFAELKKHHQELHERLNE